MAKKASSLKQMCSYLNKADWLLVFALLINIRLDQTIIVFSRYILQSFFTRKYTPDVLQAMGQADYTALQTTFTNLDAIITFGLGFILPAIALLLALSARKNATSKPLVAVSILVSLLVMFSSLVSSIGYILSISA